MQYLIDEYLKLQPTEYTTLDCLKEAVKIVNKNGYPIGLGVARTELSRAGVWIRKTPNIEFGSHPTISLTKQETVDMLSNYIALNTSVDVDSNIINRLSKKGAKYLLEVIQKACDKQHK